MAKDKEPRDAEQSHSDAEPERLGDVLGISDTSPDVEIPRATTDRSGNPAGIDVRQHATGTGELRRNKGATGIDMGGAGSGTDRAAETGKPNAARSDINE
jgi:hypothetical protein